MTFYRWDDGDLLINVHVQPRASRDALAGPHGDALKVRITAAPVDGKANAHLARFLAAEFGVTRSAVELLGGDTGRRKMLRIRKPRRCPDGIEPA
ncbi:MAG TPA: DUF167 family protein [Gammaproteobacteria bacterium]